MAEITLAAELGRPVGSAASRRLRNQGRIPAVVYGHGTDPLPISVAARELRTALSTEAGINALLSLQVEGGSGYLAMARDIQRHPVRHTVIHVDFQVVNRDEAVTADVPLNLVGEAVEVGRADGIVEQQLFSVPVKATPADIPNSLEIDVSRLTVGDSLRVADISLPARVEVDVDPDTVAVTAIASRLARGAEGAAAEEGAAGTEGGAAGAEGEPLAAADTAGTEGEG